MPTKTERDTAGSADQRIAHLTRRAARGFNRALQARLAEHGVSFGQWIFLRILWDHDGLSQRELSDHANLTEPTTHAALQKLEGLGYVRREKRPGNNRRQYTVLTPAGRALREMLEPLAIEVNDVALAGLDTGEIAHLRSLLNRVLVNLEEHETREIRAGRKVPPTRRPVED